MIENPCRNITFSMSGINLGTEPEKIKIADLTVEQCEQYHKELWTWLAESGSDNKLDWPGWNRFDKQPTNNCFACVVVCELNVNPGGAKCFNCPLKWPAGLDCYAGATDDDDDVSLWDRWCDCETNDARKPLAQQIVDLPWDSKGHNVC